MIFGWQKFVKLQYKRSCSIANGDTFNINLNISIGHSFENYYFWSEINYLSNAFYTLLYQSAIRCYSILVLRMAIMLCWFVFEKLYIHWLLGNCVITVALFEEYSCHARAGNIASSWSHRCLLWRWWICSSEMGGHHDIHAPSKSKSAKCYIFQF